MTGIHYSAKIGAFYVKTALTNEKQRAVGDSSDPEDNVFAVSGRVGVRGEIDGFKYDSGLYGVRFGDVTKAASEETYVYGAFADLSLAMFRIEIEGIAANFDDTAGSSSPFGFQIMPAIELSESFDFVLRYAYLDTDDGKGIDISSTFRNAPDTSVSSYEKANSYYIGGNWFIDGNNLKFTFGYEFADYDSNAGDAAVNGVRARLQLLF